MGRSQNFYERGLGWKRSSLSTDDLVLFPLGGIGLALYSRNKLAMDIGLGYEPSSFAGLTLSYNAASIAVVDQLME
jgi:hypothetical protein